MSRSRSNQTKKCALCQNYRRHNDLCQDCYDRIEARARELNNEKMISGSCNVIHNVTKFIDDYIVKNNKIVLSQSQFCELVNKVHPLLVGNNIHSKQDI